MHDRRSFLNPTYSSLNMVSTLFNLAQKYSTEYLSRYRHRNYSSPIATIDQVFLLENFWYHSRFYISRTFSFPLTLPNKTTKHVALICVAALNMFAVSWSSTGTLIFLVWPTQFLDISYLLLLVCSWCLWPLLTGYVSCGSSLFRVVWKCSTHVCNWSIVLASVRFFLS